MIADLITLVLSTVASREMQHQTRNSDNPTENLHHLHRSESHCSLSPSQQFFCQLLFSLEHERKHVLTVENNFINLKNNDSILFFVAQITYLFSLTSDVPHGPDRCFL